MVVTLMPELGVHDVTRQYLMTMITGQENSFLSRMTPHEGGLITSRLSRVAE
jgi:hypothetical protein